MGQFSAEWRSGWRVIASGTLGGGLGFGLLLLTAGIFIVPMQEEFGWPRSVVAIAPVISIIAAILYPWVGVLTRRFGPRRIALIGLTMLAAAYLLLAFAPRNMLIFYLIILYAAAAGAMSSSLVFTTGVLTWFRKGAGSAIGVTASGVSLMGAIALPLLSMVIAENGWRAGYLALAATVAVVGLPMTFALFFERRDAPVDAMPQARGGAAPVSDGLKDVRFWILVASFGSAGLAIGGFMGHNQPILTGYGHSPVAAAMFGSIFIFCLGIGRMVAGFLLDHFDPPRVVTACFLLSAAGAALLVAGGADSTWAATAVAVGLLGLAQGAETDFCAYFTVKLFGEARFAVLYGILSMIVTMLIAAGGILFALSFDLFGDYRVALWSSVAILIVSALSILAVSMPRREASAPAEAAGELA